LSILTVGPYPPPIGGVSIHLSRLKDHLDSLKFKNTVWSLSETEDLLQNIRRVSFRNLHYRLIFNPSFRIIHYHVSGYPARKRAAYLSRTLFRNRINVITLHGDAIRFVESYPQESIEIFNSFSTVICVKKGDAKKLLSCGVKTDVQDISPFILPQNLDATIESQIVSEFMDRHEHVICANGSKITFLHDNELYGLDMCVELMGCLSVDHLDVGFVFYLSKSNDHKYLEKIRNRITELNLNDSFLLYEGEEQFFPVIRKSSIFIRPTNTDGDALSIREALHSGVPVITSDVVARPEECVLFANRNLDDLVVKTKDLFSNLEQETNKLKRTKLETGLKPMISVYEKYGARKY
jgi:glycosyltransferase involved in cell wall biosynthesis